jgi:3-phenylpropionate/cinnamic acid dioxygenase small subunit
MTDPASGGDGPVGEPSTGAGPRLARTPAFFALQAEVADVLSSEAELLDERRYEEWLDFVADDVVYFVPMQRNVEAGTHHQRERTREGRDIHWFEDDKWTLAKRVEQIRTGVHWAEEPLSRIAHLTTNVQIQAAHPTVDEATEVMVRCRFVVYQNRVEYEEYLFVGKRTDTLRRAANPLGWELVRRDVTLDQNVLLAKNLTVFL